MGQSDLLVDRAQHGDKGKVRELLLSKVSPDTLDKNQCSALWAACHAGHLPIVNELLAAGAKECRVGGQLTWASLACVQHPLVVQRLLRSPQHRKGAWGVDAQGRTLLHLAVAREASLQLVQALLRHLPTEYLAVVDRHGYTPLGLAAWMGNAAGCQALLQAGADAHAGQATKSPLALAVRRGTTAGVVRVLMQHGGLVLDGKALVRVVYQGQTDVCVALLRHGQPVAGVLAKWRLLSQDPQPVQWPLVYLAAWQGHLQLLELLTLYTPRQPPIAAAHPLSEVLVARGYGACLLHLWSSGWLEAPNATVHFFARNESLGHRVLRRRQWPLVARLHAHRRDARRGRICYWLLRQQWIVPVVDLVLAYDGVGILAQLGAQSLGAITIARRRSLGAMGLNDR